MSAAATLRRAIDITAAAALLVAFAPLLLLIALLVKARLGGPVLFRQRRPGLHGRPFELLKFRTMTEARDVHGQLLPDAARLTPFGRWLRSTSLDELPSLVNLLRGELTLVGPRPLLMDYVSRYSPEQQRRHTVKPGITGWAQVNGRNDLPWDEKLALDVWYVDHRSAWLDLVILMRTVGAVFSRAGVTRQGYATTSDFMGPSNP